MDKIVTIGVYGFDKTRFFQALVDTRIDTFCDIRLRRGMRGSKYTFANSERLQEELRTLGIRYIHIKELAPSIAIRDKQKQEDAKLGIAKRSREFLGATFIQEYTAGCLSCFNSAQFSEMVGPHARNIALFCVEGHHDACHRSLVANHLGQDLQLSIEHIRSPVV